MITIGGNVCIRNGLELDYCWREAIESLLPVCDTVTVSDGESTDGTQQELREWQQREPKLRLCIYPWPNPKGDVYFWTTWLNTCRAHIKEDFHFQLDADEILSERSYPIIEQFKQQHAPGDRIALWAKRYNFWRDTKHLIPHGECCSHRVVRLAPQPLFLASDGPDTRGDEVVGMAVETNPPVEIFHYGFLRKKKAFFEKARRLQGYFFCTGAAPRYDARLEEVERKDGNWMEEIKNVEWTNRLLPFDGDHPSRMRQWIAERAL